MTARATHAIDYADIQGDILRAYGKRYERTSYMLLHIDHAPGGQAWLGVLLGQVTSAAPWSGSGPDTTLNVALTYTGLKALGVPGDILETFSDEFREGMAARAEILGDLGESAPANWESPLGSGTAHVLVTINALDAQLLEDKLNAFRGAVEAADGVSIVHEQHAQLLKDVREHFGYADGFAQPAIAGVTDHRTLGGGVPEKEDRWRGLALGEFILGYEDEDSLVDPGRALPSAPTSPLGRSGTYMIYRKLSQDVALFRKTLREAAQLYEGGDEEKLAAKVAGRWRNGTPLVSSPGAPDPSFNAEDLVGNAFRYLDSDEDGSRCPLGAHIRRANPRDALGWKGLDDSGLLSFRHRIIRRGMPYGPPLPPDAGESDGGEDRGLMFVCFNASISRQFEGIQTQWINDGNAFGLGHDKDFLLGDSNTTDKMTVQGDPPFFISPQPSFVTTRGGEYLFVPGLAALRFLASGARAGSA
ncbi:MAG: Dyp-type peroxidase [Solirubrobacteraceae bacterium]